MVSKVVEKGKHCVEAAQSVIEATSQDDAQQAMAHLLSLQAECRYLEKHTQSIIELLRMRLDVVVRKNAECSRKEKDLQSQIQSAKASLVAEKTTQKVHQDLVKVAEKEVERAEQTPKDEKKIKEGYSGIVGTILGFLAPRAQPFWDTLAEPEGAVDRAKDNLRDRR